MAVTEVAAVITTVQVPVPLQPLPDQPANVEPTAGAAVSVTTVLKAKLALQVAPQLIPAGDDVTVPVPVPVRATVRVSGATLKVAVTVVAAVTVTTQVPVPVQPPPDQPANAEPAAGDAVSVTMVPDGYGSEQSAPQLMPPGADVTVPMPVPASATARV